MFESNADLNGEGTSWHLSIKFQGVSQKLPQRKKWRMKVTLWYALALVVARPHSRTLATLGLAIASMYRFILSLLQGRFRPSQWHLHTTQYAHIFCQETRASWLRLKATPVYRPWPRPLRTLLSLISDVGSHINLHSLSNGSQLFGSDVKSWSSGLMYPGGSMSEHPLLSLVAGEGSSLCLYILHTL